MKEGNPFEDIALIDALYNHITKVSAYQLHIRDTCKALIEINQDNEAREIQIMYKEITRAINDSLNEIWIEDLQVVGPNLNEGNTIYTNLKNEQRYSLLGKYIFYYVAFMRHCFSASLAKSLIFV